MFGAAAYLVRVFAMVIIHLLSLFVGVGCV